MQDQILLNGIFHPLGATSRVYEASVGNTAYVVKVLNERAPGKVTITRDDFAKEAEVLQQLAKVKVDGVKNPFPVYHGSVSSSASTIVMTPVAALDAKEGTALSGQYDLFLRLFLKSPKTYRHERILDLVEQHPKSHPVRAGSACWSQHCPFGPAKEQRAREQVHKRSSYHRLGLLRACQCQPACKAFWRR